LCRLRRAKRKLGINTSYIHGPRQVAGPNQVDPVDPLDGGSQRQPPSDKLGHASDGHPECLFVTCDCQRSHPHHSGCRGFGRGRESGGGGYFGGYRYFGGRWSGGF
jgi:hypothetical protein